MYERGRTKVQLSADMTKRWGKHRQPSRRDQSFGTLRVLLTIMAAQTPNTKLSQCISPHSHFPPPNTPFLVSPKHVVPKGRSAPTQSRYTQYAMTPTSPKELGIGNPSKKLAFPGRSAAVALNLANLASPAQMNPVKAIVSTGVLRPTQNAKSAGATPNEICGGGG